MNFSKKQQIKRSPMHSSQAQFEMHPHGSPELRDLNNRETFTKKSKEKINKQPSSAIFKHVRSDTSDTAKRPTSFVATVQNARRSAANVHEIDYPDPNLLYRHKHHNTLQSLECDEAHGMGKSNSYRQFATQGQDKHMNRVPDEDISRTTVSATTSSLLKCYNHPLKDAKYLVELNQDEDILCCMECGNNLAAKGCQLEEISSVKSKRNYELDSFLQKSLQSMETLKKCLGHLPDHFNSLMAELKQQMNTHDNYYSKFIDYLLKKKEQTQRLLMNCLNKLTDQFNTIHKNFHAQLSELEVNYNEIIVNREDIRRMNELDFTRIIKKYQTRLVIPQSALNPEVELWKVETVDTINFEKDIETYLMKVDEENQKVQIDVEEILNQVDQSTESIVVDESSGLLCEEEFQWGYKLPKTPVATQQNQDIYFSFEKKQGEGTASSPTFKQL